MFSAVSRCLALHSGGADLLSAAAIAEAFAYLMGMTSEMNSDARSPGTIIEFRLGEFVDSPAKMRCSVAQPIAMNNTQNRLTHAFCCGGQTILGRELETGG